MVKAGTFTRCRLAWALALLAMVILAISSMQSLRYNWNNRTSGLWTRPSIARRSRIAPELAAKCSTLLDPNLRIGASLTYRCVADEQCGGLGDRIKGVISSFTLAALTNRKFMIAWTRFTRLEEYWVPNRWDWEYTTLPGKASDVNAIDTGNWASRIAEVTAVPPSGAVMLAANSPVMPVLIQDHPAASNTSGLVSCDDTGHALHAIFHTLFTASPALAAELTQHVDPDCWRVAIHLRTGGAASFADPQLMNDAGVEWIQGMATYVATIRPSACFSIFSDSSAHAQILVAALKAINARVWVADEELQHMPLAHMDREPQNVSLAGDLRAFVEHALMMHSHLIIAAPSGFSASASEINCIPLTMREADPNAESKVVNGVADYGSFSVMLDGLCVPRRPPMTPQSVRHQPAAYFATTRQCSMADFLGGLESCLPAPRPTENFWI